MYKKWWLQSFLNMKLIKRSLMVMQPAHSRKLEMKRVVIAPIGHCRGRLKGGMKVKQEAKQEAKLPRKEGGIELINEMTRKKD